MQMQQAQQQQKQDIELNEFMLRLIEVLNKRLGGLQSQISALDRKTSDASAAKAELDGLKSEFDSTKAVLLARVSDLESKLRETRAAQQQQQQQQPASPKVNQGILKHLEQ